uniref:PDZ domain-containing protein n=1 Tax=Panagrellus redivivus TaxID=6233 RepID=A0A7E4W4X1_PANRE
MDTCLSVNGMDAGELANATMEYVEFTNLVYTIVPNLDAPISLALKISIAERTLHYVEQQNALSACQNSKFSCHVICRCVLRHSQEMRIH